jgi:hypothetical protein
MIFTKEVENLFRNAGWFPGRDVSAQMNYPKDNYPEFLKEFLSEYGLLCVSSVMIQEMISSNILTINPQEGREEYKDGYFEIFHEDTGIELFGFGYYEPDGYDVAADVNGRVYMIGDMALYRGKNLIEGIENILMLQWNKCLKQELDTDKWWNDHGEYVDFENFDLF